MGPRKTTAISTLTADHMTVRPTPQLAVAFARVTAILIGLSVWHRLLSTLLEAVVGPLPGFVGLLATGLVTGGLFIAGLVLFTRAYVAYRDIEFGLALPSRTDLPMVGVAGVLPLALVGLTKLVGSVVGVPYNSLTKTAVAADAAAGPVLLLTGLSVLLTVPVLVVVCQVLVQGSFEQVVDGDTAIGLTTLLTGFVMVSNTGGLTIVPDEGKLAGAVLFALVLGLAVHVNDRYPRDQLRYLAYIPLAVVTTLLVVAGLAELGSLAGALFAVTHLAVFAVAAFTYDRTGSILAPAVAYTTLVLANRAVVVLFEAGIQSW